MNGGGAGGGGGYSVSGTLSKARGYGIEQGFSRVQAPGWFKPQRRAYLKDVSRLRGPNPYAGTDLGLDPNTLAMIPGGTRDMAAGAKEGAAQSINDIYAMPGGPGMGSYAHNAALSSMENEYAGSVAESAREAALADASLRRTDYDRRLAAGADVGQLARAFATQKFRKSNRQNDISGSVTGSYGA